MRTTSSCGRPVRLPSRGRSRQRRTAGSIPAVHATASHSAVGPCRFCPDPVQIWLRPGPGSAWRQKAAGMSDLPCPEQTRVGRTRQFTNLPKRQHIPALPAIRTFRRAQAAGQIRNACRAPVLQGVAHRFLPSRFVMAACGTGHEPRNPSTSVCKNFLNNSGILAVRRKAFFLMARDLHVRGQRHCAFIPRGEGPKFGTQGVQHETT